MNVELNIKKGKSVDLDLSLCEIMSTEGGMDFISIKDKVLLMLEVQLIENGSLPSITCKGCDVLQDTMFVCGNGKIYELDFCPICKLGTMSEVAINKLPKEVMDNYVNVDWEFLGKNTVIH